MKYFFTLFTAMILGSTGYAQIDAYFVLSSTGTYTSIEGVGSLSTTVGELTMVKTFTGAGHIITQGFQQGNMLRSAPTSLPVRLLTFEGYNIDGYNHLIWQTASEIDNAGFDIERLSPSNEFEKIGFVKGNGNSNALVEYIYDDKKAPHGISYYRLKQKDVDGKFTYSEIVSIYSGGKQETDISVYPMPVLDLAHISIHSGENTTGTMTITSIIGATMYEGPIELEEGGVTLSIDMRSYAAGQYFVRVNTGALTKTLQIVRQ